MYDKFFDFDGDGKLSPMERTLQMMEEEMIEKEYEKKYQSNRQQHSTVPRTNYQYAAKQPSPVKKTIGKLCMWVPLLFIAIAFPFLLFGTLISGQFQLLATPAGIFGIIVTVVDILALGIFVILKLPDKKEKKKAEK